jgi:hypothetical protein
MGGGAIFLCVLGFIAVVVVIGVISGQRSRARTAALNDWALRNEWTVARRPAVTWGRRMPGRNRRGVSLAVSGLLNGRSVTIAEYSYTTSSTTTHPAGMGPGGTAGGTTTNTTTHRYVLTVVRLSRAYPSIGVYQRGTLSKLGRSLFGDKSTALGQEEFDRAFRVTADQPGLVSTVLSRDVVAAQVAGELPDWSVEGNELLTFRSGQLGDPAGIPAQFAPLLRVADLLEPASRTAD